MPLLMISLGIALLVAAYQGKHQDVTETLIYLYDNKQFRLLSISLMVLLAWSYYSPKNSHYPAMFAMLLALSIGLEKEEL